MIKILLILIYSMLLSACSSVPYIILDNKPEYNEFSEEKEKEKDTIEKYQIYTETLKSIDSLNYIQMNYVCAVVYEKSEITGVYMKIIIKDNSGHLMDRAIFNTVSLAYNYGFGDFELLATKSNDNFSTNLNLLYEIQPSIDKKLLKWSLIDKYTIKMNELDSEIFVSVERDNIQLYKILNNCVNLNFDLRNKSIKKLKEDLKYKNMKI